MSSGPVPSRREAAALRMLDTCLAPVIAVGIVTPGIVHDHRIELAPNVDGLTTSRSVSVRRHPQRAITDPRKRPESRKNRLHLDLCPTGRDDALPLGRRIEIVEAKVSELVGLGTSVERRTRGDDPEDPSYYVVMHDPEGNEFCVS